MSKELTPLEALAGLRIDAGHHLDDHVEYLNKRLDIIEKSLKALEIIKEKHVDIDALLKSPSLTLYNTILTVRNENKYILTKEEYDLLKEVLL